MFFDAKNIERIFLCERETREKEFTFIINTRKRIFKQSSKENCVII